MRRARLHDGEDIFEMLPGPAQTRDLGMDFEAALEKLVYANTVRGDIVIKGGTGVITASLGVPENANATFTIRTYQGSFSTDLPLAGVSRADIQRGRRVVTTLGNGSADVSLETFGGSIRVRRGTAARPHGRERD